MPGREFRTALTADSVEQQPKRSRTRWWRLVWTGIVVLVLLAAFTLVYNNYSFHQQSRAQFDAQLDAALERATVWIAANPVLSLRNPSVMYMIADMESLSHDPRLKKLLNLYRFGLSRPTNVLDFVWMRIPDRQAPVPVITARELQGTNFEYLWDSYAVAPQQVQISPEERANMFSPTKYYWGARQHQLLALVMYRDFNGSDAELDSTINHLSEKIARDAHYDFRVSDSYIQRTTFVLAAGRPDLIRRRWVERILDNQTADGSWKYCWYGWCRGIFEFNLTNPGHPTVQAAWALTMLKYRYPQWIEEHYR